MRITKELSFVLPNKPGTLAAVTTALAKAKVNLLAIDASVGFDYNIVRFVPDQPARAIAVLKRMGVDVGSTDVLCTTAKNQPGALAQIAAKCGRAKLNLDYLYASAGTKGSESLIVLHTSDPKRAAKVLA